MHQKLLMNGLIIDHENIDIDHLILKEFILLVLNKEHGIV